MAKSRSKKKDRRPVNGLVAFDFDGVLSKGTRYHWPLDELDLSLIAGAHERGYAVAVMTCNDVTRVAGALRQRGLRVFADVRMTREFWSDPEVVLVTNRKVAAKLYVDDRAVRYQYGQPASVVYDTLDEIEGFRPCPAGRHWGPYGGAGALPWTRFRGQLYVLLGQRSCHVQKPGTWSAFGGALDTRNEDTWAAAQRELGEEVDGLDYCVADWSDYYAYQCPSCGWRYVTFLAEVLATDPGDDRDAWLPRARVGDRFETDRVRWVRVADVDALELHPGFAEAWPALRRSLEHVAGEQAA